MVIIWFKGGSNAYYFHSQANITPIVYDGVQNALPYQETNGPSRTYITSVSPYLNTNGITNSGNAYFNGSGNNYMNGNLGLGTTTPDAKLAVNGTIHTKEIKVDLSGWSDYVFEPKYSLPSLNSVKSYIDQNHRLPEMPSTKEVIKNGVNLSEMVNLQTKKIEELTLYLIDKDKQITDQQKTNQLQQDQINQLQKQLEIIAQKLK